MKTSPRPWTMGDNQTSIRDAVGKPVVKLTGNIDEGWCMCGCEPASIEVSPADLLLIVAAVNAYKGPLAE